MNIMLDCKNNKINCKLIFGLQLSCFPASMKKNEAPPNNRDYTVPETGQCSGEIENNSNGTIHKKRGDGDNTLPPYLDCAVLCPSP